MSKKSYKKSNPFMIISKIILLILTAVYPFFMVIMSGAGLIYNRESYGQQLYNTGILFIVSGILMSTAAVLCMSRKSLPNLISPVLSCVGFVICMIMLGKLIDHADSSGWSDKFTMTPVSSMYKTRITPVIMPFLLTLTVSIIQFFSYDAIEERRIKRERKKAAKNAPAPSIVDEDD